MKKAFLGLALIAAVLVSCKDTKTTTEENKGDSLVETPIDQSEVKTNDSETGNVETKIEDTKTTEVAVPTKEKK
jgi:hypothetical protein